MPSKKTRMSLSRRRSLDILAAFAEEAAKPSPSLFNLVDLILMSIKSNNRQTVIATLRLLAVILQRHHSFAGSLIKTTPSYQETQRTVGALNAELEQFLSMATTIVDDPTLDESYENYLRDATFILESRLFLLTPSVGNFPDGPADRPLDVRKDDAVLKEILRLLDSFFTNSVVVNLALTEVITSLASSNLVSLDGWLLVEPSNYEYEPEAVGDSGMQSPEPGTESQPNQGDSDPFSVVKFAYKQPAWATKNVPLVTAGLLRLVSHVDDWRREIPDFDVLIAARRDLLHQEEQPQSQATPIRSREPSEPSMATPNGRPLQRVARLEAESTSPRGRNTRPFDISDGSPSRLALGGTPPRSSVGSPLREQSVRTPPSRGESSRSAVADDLRRRLAEPFKIDRQAPAPETRPIKSATASSDSPAAVEEQPSSQDTGETVTLGHVLTNTIILYEFILELAALVQVRGSLFQEAGYTR